MYQLTVLLTKSIKENDAIFGQVYELFTKIHTSQVVRVIFQNVINEILTLSCSKPSYSFPSHFG